MIETYNTHHRFPCFIDLIWSTRVYCWSIAWLGACNFLYMCMRVWYGYFFKLYAFILLTSTLVPGIIELRSIQLTSFINNGNIDEIA